MLRQSYVTQHKRALLQPRQVTASFQINREKENKTDAANNHSSNRDIALLLHSLAHIYSPLLSSADFEGFGVFVDGHARPGPLRGVTMARPLRQAQTVLTDRTTPALRPQPIR